MERETDGKGRGKERKEEGKLKRVVYLRLLLSGLDETGRDNKGKRGENGGAKVEG